MLISFVRYNPIWSCMHLDSYNHVMQLLTATFVLLQVNAYIISHLYDSMPSVFGKDKAKAKLIADLDKIFQQISDKFRIPLGESSQFLLSVNCISCEFSHCLFTLLMSTIIGISDRGKLLILLYHVVQACSM